LKELHVKNQLNDGLTIEFCCGEKEYKLGLNEEIVVEIEEDTCMYLDVVYRKDVNLGN
jgi:hypothetical protein